MCDRTSAGSVRYEAHYEGPLFPRSEHKWNSKFPTVVVKSTGPETLSVEVECSISHDREKTTREAKLAVEYVICELAFRYPCVIERPVECGSTLRCIAADGTVTTPVSASLTSAYRCEGAPEKVPDAAGVGNAIAAAHLSSQERHVDLELFRSAMATAGVAGRFILLYTTLQQATGTSNSQDRLDTWICKKTDGRPSKKPAGYDHRLRETETVFTRVRSEMGHVRGYIRSFDLVLADAASLVEELRALVVLAISEKPYGREQQPIEGR